MTFCDVCELPIIGDAHDDHHHDCPNRHQPATVDCTCDLTAHEWCCHTCTQEASA